METEIKRNRWYFKIKAEHSVYIIYRVQGFGFRKPMLYWIYSDCAYLELAEKEWRRVAQENGFDDHLA